MTDSNDIPKCPAPKLEKSQWKWGADFRNPSSTCGNPVPQPATGRPRKFCSDACRQAAYRTKHPRNRWYR